MAKTNRTPAPGRLVDATVRSAGGVWMHIPGVAGIPGVPGAGFRTLLLLIIAGLFIGLGGCASKVPSGEGLPRAEGSYNPPRVISATPERDQLALAAADDQLTEAHWRILEKLGPKPIWQQLQKKQKRSDHITGGDDPLVPPPHADAPPAAEPIDESTLPITNLDAPEGRSRFTWVLRSLGGSMVASTRDASTSRRAVSISPPDLAPLLAVLTQQLGDQGTVTAMPRENTLVINCTASLRPQVIQLLNELDTPPPQVEITAKIFEVSQDFDFQQGAELVLNRLVGDDAQTLISTFSAKRFAEAVGSTTPTQGSALRLLEVFQDAGISVDFTFQLLAESGLIQVVSAPRMTVAVGQTGYMLAGQELPIQSLNIVNNLVQSTTQYKPVGVQLYITPQAASDERIKLHTISIVSAVSGFAPLPTLHGGMGKNFFNPIIDSREAETAVTINDGDTLVISGLRMIRSTTREAKIPGIGDVPGLEWMFKNHRTQQQVSDLYFFVTPTLLPTYGESAE